MQQGAGKLDIRGRDQPKFRARHCGRRPIFCRFGLISSGSGERWSLNGRLADRFPTHASIIAFGHHCCSQYDNAEHS